MSRNIRTRGGYTPLILAAMHKRKKVYQLLLETYGADPDLRDYSGRKAIHYVIAEEGTDDVNGDNGDEVDHNRNSLDAFTDKSMHFLRGVIRESKRRPKSEEF